MFGIKYRFFCSFNLTKNTRNFSFLLSLRIKHASWRLDYTREASISAMPGGEVRDRYVAATTRPPTMNKLLTVALDGEMPARLSTADPYCNTPSLSNYLAGITAVH